MRVLYFLLFIGLAGEAVAQPGLVTGTVKADGKPVAGASVSWTAEKRLGTVTGSGGQFRLELTAGDSGTLVISHAGFQSRTSAMRVAAGETRVEVVLERVLTELDEVVVTGVSRAMSIRESPLAMKTVSTKDIEQSSAANVIDAISAHAPGLAVVKTGPNVSKPFINGLGYNRVLTLYDGLRVETQQWGDEHGVPMDDYAIERAEVIKGPASLLYGSDAIAGVLQLFPAVPHGQDGALHVRVLSEYQSNNGLVGNGLMVSRGSEHWSWALRGSERIARGYTNPVDGRVYNTGFRTGNASAFLGYSSRDGYSHFNVTWYDNHQGIPDGSRDSLTRKFTYQVYESPGENVLEPFVDDIKSRPPVPEKQLNSYDLSALTQRIQDLRVYTDNGYSLGIGDIRLSLGYEENRRREYNHPTSPEQVGEYLLLRTVSYGLRYNAPVFFNLELSAGVNGMYQLNRNDAAATDFPIPDYRLSDLGSYLYGKWKKGNWTIAGGVRYDRRSVRGDEMYASSNPLTGFYRQTGSEDTLGALHPFAPFALDFQGVSGSIGATVRLSDNISAKANIARGYRAPNITEMASNGLDPGAHIYYIGNLNFSPEFSLQEDAGLTGDWADWGFGVNVFNNHINRYIYQDQAVDAVGVPLVIVPGNRTFQFQQTDAQVYGGDAQLRISPTLWRGLRFEETFSCVYGFNRAGRYRKTGSEGEYLPFIPPPRLLSVAEFERGIWRVRAELDHNWRQDRYLGLYQTETPTSAYTLVNCMVHVELKVGERRRLQLQAMVNNLFNVAYQSHLSRLQYFEYYTASPNGRLGIFDMGRNLCLKAIWEMH
ncbi:MAG TPA: TonB-dependent receptor [Puia sp.]|uniref:TonB-dependent receptor n=1 Tax=Puia sp. TaxID=2045100 RepID=UPI002BF8AF6B|nr:TonB-dependent receptor [Puia sp.]HVU94054.1 TonB-dependent receptor [Puia sp.]